MPTSARYQQQPVIQTPQAASARPGPSVAAAGVGANAPGPAVALQQRLEDAFAAPGERWSPRKTLSFIGLTCGGFWLGVGYCVWALTR